MADTEEEIKRVASGDLSDLDQEDDESQEDDAEQDESLELDDGTTEPTSEEGLPEDTSAQFKIDPIGNVDFNFREGNYSDITTIPNKLTQFTTSFTRTFLPIVESSLIGLLGNSNNYQRDKCDVSISLQNNQPKLTGTLIYTIPLWIGDDISTDSITQDAKAIYEKLKTIPQTQITQCKIDCTEGSLTVGFIYG
jgi:hypothetical protein